MLEIRSLDQSPLFQIVNCFNRAFADYFVPFHVTEEYMRQRWRGSRVNYNLSFGAFAGSKLVGFIIIGIDQWSGRVTAYNAGTGVIPEYRGQGIAGQIYQQLIPALKDQGVQHGVLEVICENDRAIRTYEKVGYKKDRKVHCVGGKISSTLPLTANMNIQQKKFPEWEAYHNFATFPACWDNHKNAITIQPTDYEAIHLFDRDHLVAYAIWKPEQNYVAQFAQIELKHGQMLFHYLKEQSPAIKINNIDTADKSNLEMVKTIGLQKIIDQWEMSAAW